ncbi:MAG: Glyoxalase/bleomycin resistance protein/dioxygenase [Gemmatimonadetes bacterium]|nr:Glyoxalase/bleomycin resistance protein/dioxygenase [Gemmatimonadota bacterium]
MRTNRSIPAATVIPVLAYDDVQTAVDWLCAAFGFSERLRIADHRAQLNVGAGAVVVSERKPDPPGDQSGEDVGRGHSVMVRVEDADAHCRQAGAHGARIVRAPADHPYGERQYTAVDPGGHVWTFTQTIADVDPADWGGVLRDGSGEDTSNPDGIAGG